MTKLTLNVVLYLLLAFAPPAWATVSSEFETPLRYRQSFAVIDFGAQAQASALIERSRMDYQAALDSAIAMEGEIERFLATLTQESLTAVRDAWRAAREHYQRAEWTRFVDGPIDWPQSTHRLAGPEARLNAWPVNEAVIDYVHGQPSAGIINDLSSPLSTETRMHNPPCRNCRPTFGAGR